MPLKRHRLTNEIATAIQEQIAELGLRTGDRTPSHAMLAEQLGISVPSLREGLQTLAAMGVVQLEHGRGTIVRRPSLSAFVAGIHPVLLRRSYSTTECVTTLAALLDRAVPDLINVQRRDRPLPPAIGKLETAKDAASAADALQRFYADLVYPLHQELTSDLVEITLRLMMAVPVTTESLIKGSAGLVDVLTQFVNAVERGDTAEARRLVGEQERLLGGLLPSDRRLVCATGSIGGTFYTAGLELAQALQAGSTCLMRPVPSAGGLDNIARLTKNCADIVFTQAHVAEAAYHGLPPFGKPHRDLRVIARTHSLDLWIVSSAAAGITSLEDIRGRRIAMGTRGGETSRISAGILAAYGHDGSTYEQRYLSISKASEALSTGEIDLLFYLTGGMGSALTELAETHALRVLSVANPILEDLCRRESSWQIATIDTGVEPEPTTTVRVETLLVTRSRLSAGVGQGVWAALHHAARESDILRPALPDESCSLPVHTGVPHD